MNRFSFVAGATAAFFVAAGWNALQSAPVAADQTLGTALMAAVVNVNGTLARGTGAVSATRISQGSYQVKFERSVTACSHVVSAGSSASTIGFFRTVTAANPSGSGPDTVDISATFDDGQFIDIGFHLQVFCWR